MYLLMFLRFLIAPKRMIGRGPNLVRGLLAIVRQKVGKV